MTGPFAGLVTVGEGMVEFHAEAPGLFRQGFAGDVVNTAIHASRLGLPAALLSRIGDDFFAGPLRAAWLGEGLDLSHAPTVPGENGLYVITTDARGERSFTYRRAGSAASQLSPADLDAAWLLGADMVLTSGITQAISETAQALVAAIAALPNLRPRLAHDPNHRPNLWARRGGDAAARAALMDVRGRVAWLLPSWPADAVLLPGAPASAEAAARAFAAEGADVALKMGADGVLILQSGHLTHVPAQPVAQVVDSTGAGDAWNAAFLVGLIRGETAVKAAAAANAHAATVLSHRGAIPPR